MASTGSPRNKRKTTCFFRLADHRFTSAAAPGALPVALRAPSTAPGTTSAIFDFFSMFNSVSRNTFYPKIVSRKIGGGSAQIIADIAKLTDMIETMLVLNVVDFHLLRVARSLLVLKHPSAALDRLQGILLSRCNV